MSSNINPYNIDGTFPVAGQDNSSQGFRDNFTNIKNNFLFAQTEIDDLQNKVIVTSALNGQAINNDMAGTQIRRPQLVAWTQTLYDVGAVSGSVSLDFNEANFQKITTAEPISLDFINWQSTGAGALGYGLMRVWIVISNTSHTVTLPENVNIGIEDIAGYDKKTRTITFDQAVDPAVPGAGNYIFDFSSIDGGNNFLIFDVTRNRATLRDPNLYYNDSVTNNPTLFVGFSQNGGNSTALQTAIAYEQGENIISGLGSFNSVSFGDLSLANTTNASLDTGKIAGYTITSARGNLAVANFQPVHSNDYLGYVNAVTFTGREGVGNSFQQSASMVFYATGSNVEYGLGGNIAFYTARDGGSAGNAVVQAMGIENDQSVTFYGNVNIIGSLSGANISSGGGGGSSYGNAEVATYLANFDGGINFTASPAVISGLGNISSAVVWAGNLQFIDGSYQTTAFSNVNIASYIPTDPTILNLQANIGAFETYANATFGTSSYGNANVESYIDASVRSKNYFLDLYHPNFGYNLNHWLQVSAQETTSTFAVGSVTNWLKFGGQTGTLDSKTIVLAPDDANGWKMSLGGTTVNQSGFIPPAATYITTSFIQDMFGSNIELGGTANIGGGSSNQSSITSRGSNGHGGANYHGFLFVDNYSAVNGKKYLRIDPNGSLQVVNHAYSQTIFNLTNNGDLSIGGNTIIGNTYVPTTSTDSGQTGQITYDNDNIYICLGPNNWKRANLSAW